MTHRYYIQKTVATSKFTLPVVAVISLVLWLVVGNNSAPQTQAADCWIWSYVPDWATTGWTSRLFGFLTSLMTVYLMAEANNKFVLLRISSRMLSSMLAILLTVCTFLQDFQPAHIVLLLVMLAYFPLFYTYQRTNCTAQVYVTYLIISIASLMHPKLLFLTPALWMVQITLRSFTLKTLCASALGLLTPYWLLFGTAYLGGDLTGYESHISNIFSFGPLSHDTWPLHKWLSLGIVTLTGAAGAVNFYAHSYLDKTRTRVYINAGAIMFAASLILVMCDTQHFNETLSAAIINAAILSGHHLAQRYTRASNIYTIVLGALLATIAYANYIGL